MMLFHHLFRDPKVYYGYSIQFFAPASEEFWNSIGQYCKLCVSIFAFITGYGLLKSFSKIPQEKNAVIRWNLTRIVKTMSGFWFIYILAFIVTMCIDRLPLHTYVKDEQLTASVLYAMNDFLGLSNLFSTPSLCGAWWYMSAALLFIVLVPLIYRIAHNIGYLPIILIVIGLPRILGTGYPGGNNPYTFLVAMLLGMVFADYGIFEKLTQISPSNRAVSYASNFVIWGLLVVGSFYIHESSYGPETAWELNYGFIVVVLICFFRFCVIRIPVLRSILEFLGRYSMTIFLTHIFIKTTYLHDFTYGTTDNFVAIYIMFIVVSLALAVIVDLCRKLCRYDCLIDIIMRRINMFTFR